MLKLEYPLKVYTDEDFRENFMKSTKLKDNPKEKENLQTADEIIKEVIKEERKIIVK